MDVIEGLIAGHRDVGERKDVMEKLAKNINNDALFWEDAFKVMTFLDIEARKHFAIEEKVLFPVAEKVFPQAKLALLAELESDHAEILGKIGALGAKIKEHPAAPSKTEREGLSLRAGEIMEAILLHAHKEDVALFPMVKQFFKAGDYTELEENYYKFIGV